MTEHTINIEPKWIDLGRLMIKPEFEGELDKPLQIADIVRQAQKKGVKKLIFTMDKENINIKEVF